MRLRKVKNATQIIENSEYIVRNLEENKGRWHLLFSNEKPICIEIGMGKGNFIIQMAKQYPDYNFIGIEMFDSVMARAVQKLKEEQEIIPNLRLICMNAKQIENVFEKEINTIYLNFSDPWPKLKHEKRRLTSHEFLKRYDYIWKGRAKIIQKTDNLGLFEFSMQELQTYGYRIDFMTKDLYAEKNLENNVPTEYEIKFHTMGNPIYKLIATKE